MNKTIAAVALSMLAGICSSGQSNETKKVEFFVGYSFENAAVNFGIGGLAAQAYRGRAGHNGFNASGVVNINRYFGIKGDISGTYKSGRFSFQVPSGVQSNPITTVSFDANSSIYNFLGGVQVKDNASKARLAPFVHALVGGGHRRNKIPGGGFTCITIIPCPSSTSETGFAGAFGGGLDIRLGKRIAFRIFQLDYNPIKFDAGTAHNFRFSTGVVF